MPSQISNAAENMFFQSIMIMVQWKIENILQGKVHEIHVFLQKKLMTSNIFCVALILSFM